MVYIITFKTEDGNIRTACHMIANLEEAKKLYLYCSQNYTDVKLWESKLKEVKIEILVE